MIAQGERLESLPVTVRCVAVRSRWSLTRDHGKWSFPSFPMFRMQLGCGLRKGQSGKTSSSG